MVPWCVVYRSIDRTVLYPRAHITTASLIFDAIIPSFWFLSVESCPDVAAVDAMMELMGRKRVANPVSTLFSHNASTDSDEITDRGCQSTSLVADTVTALTAPWDLA